ncbi:GPN-loop GTPase 3 [Plasmodiophora brassicae]|uniref:GPN-loop GTPase 3 n=1 Tax=Plasmodiophora brassicae TaxID=37360 RepID=A0A0G4ISQ0_PLABS|nr:hypothetical protein PBRA_006366 [Plasmodiophora brassicae]SPQ95174.1 unnamed protein product [Plasmodiophora brassicae]
MGKHAQLVVGPAGSGKSTFCHLINRHCENVGRTVHVVNLDPAAESFQYPVSIDIRDLISVTDVMEELGLGPNGALIFCMEYLIENIEWLTDQLGDYADDYLIFDCPGQIEIYTHINVMRSFVQTLERMGYRTCGVFLLDSIFVSDSSKFIAGMLSCLSTMVQLELPHVNVLSKCDLLKDKKSLDTFLDSDLPVIMSSLNATMSGKLLRLNQSIGELIDEYSMVSFVPLDPNDDDSITYILSSIDHAIQYGEDLEPVDKTIADRTEDDTDRLPAIHE